MRFLTPRRELVLADQKRAPNWDELLTPEEEELLEEMCCQGLARVVILAHPIKPGRTGEFYSVTPLGETALTCAALARSVSA